MFYRLPVTAATTFSYKIYENLVFSYANLDFLKENVTEPLENTAFAQNNYLFYLFYLFFLYYLFSWSPAAQEPVGWQIWSRGFQEKR